MGRLSGFSYREVTRKLRALGFEFDREADGSHEIWRSASTGRRISLPFHRKDIAQGTLRTILRDAGIDVDKFLRA